MRVASPSRMSLNSRAVAERESEKRVASPSRTYLNSRAVAKREEREAGRVK